MKGGPLRRVNDPRRFVRAASVKLVPIGHDQPFDPLLEHVTFTAAEKRAMSTVWDDTMGSKYAGILEAELVNGSGE